MEKGKIEAVQIVILDDVRISSAYSFREGANELRFGGVAASGCLEHFRRAGGITDGDHEDLVDLRVEPRRLEVELQPAQLVE